MIDFKTCYGMTYFDENDLKETQINHRVELEYYRTNKCAEDDFKYGIEICKKEYINDNVTVETNKVEDITNSSDKVIEIINTLKKYKVTPVGLNDVLEDLMKTN